MGSHEPGKGEVHKARTKPKSTIDLLGEWRDAERVTEGTEPGSARHELSRRQANHAREVFHDAEDAAHLRQGDTRPRDGETIPEDEAQEA